MAGAPLRTSRFTIGPGCGTQEDRHAVYEIWFISEGTVDVYYDDDWHRVSAGQAVFFESWKPHFTRNNCDVKAQIFSVWWA
jgi:quercetin dioxygenase-like cupin family protein